MLGRKEKVTLIKIRDPHLAGGEEHGKCIQDLWALPDLYGFLRMDNDRFRNSVKDSTKIYDGHVPSKIEDL